MDFDALNPNPSLVLLQHLQDLSKSPKIPKNLGKAWLMGISNVWKKINALNTTWSSWPNILSYLKIFAEKHEQSLENHLFRNLHWMKKFNSTLTGKSSTKELRPPFHFWSSYSYHWRNTWIQHFRSIFREQEDQKWLI